MALSQTHSLVVPSFETSVSNLDFSPKTITQTKQSNTQALNTACVKVTDLPLGERPNQSYKKRQNTCSMLRVRKTPACLKPTIQTAKTTHTNTSNEAKSTPIKHTNEVTSTPKTTRNMSILGFAP